MNLSLGRTDAVEKIARALKPLLSGATEVDAVTAAVRPPESKDFRALFLCASGRAVTNESCLCIEAPQERPAFRIPLKHAEQTVGRSVQAVWFVTPERHAA